LRFPDHEKPYVELVAGHLERKVSPKRMHGRLQLHIGRWLEDWAGDRGEVATEWRFYLAVGESRPSSLVPDVAYVSYERLPRSLPKDARERPRIAPDIAVEIWSPGDRKKTWEKKIALYLEHGARVVIAMYPEKRVIEFHRADGSRAFPASGARVRGSRPRCRRAFSGDLLKVAFGASIPALAIRITERDSMVWTHHARSSSPSADSALLVLPRLRRRQAVRRAHSRALGAQDEPEMDTQLLAAAFGSLAYGLGRGAWSGRYRMALLFHSGRKQAVVLGS
jgi:Uma2 family endonuclease